MNSAEGNPSSSAGSSMIVATAYEDPLGMKQVPPSSIAAEVAVGESENYIKHASTLYQLILEGSWDAVIEQCRLAPKEAKQWVIRGDIDSWRRLPLHEACIRQANVDVVKALVEAFPLAAKSFDHSARLPLHHACFHGCSVEVIRVLVGAYPTGLEKKDVFEKTPLILAGSSSSKNKSLIMETLMKGPAECIIEGHRYKWEKEQQALLSSLHEEFHQERAAIEHKLKTLTEDSKRQAYLAEKEILKKNSNIDELNKVIFDLNGQVEALTNMEKNLRSNIKEMEDRFSNLCVTNHIASKKQQDTILHQTNTIASLEAHIEECNKNVADMSRKMQEKHASDAKFTKQITELRATVLELKTKEDTLHQEITKYRADLTASRREVLALVQKSEKFNEREQEMEAVLNNVTKELEAAKESNTLLQEGNIALQEQINNMTITHQEALGSSTDMHKQLEVEKNTLQEEVENLQKELEERETAIKFMEQSATSDRETSAKRIQELEDQLRDMSTTLTTQQKTSEEEKQQLTQIITTLKDDAERVKEEVQAEQAKAQETIRLFKSALRKFTGDLNKGAGTVMPVVIPSETDTREN